MRPHLGIAQGDLDGLRGEAEAVRKDRRRRDKAERRRGHDFATEFPYSWGGTHPQSARRFVAGIAVKCIRKS